MHYIRVNGFDLIKSTGPFTRARKLVTSANNQLIGGYDDWVLPDVITLQALRHSVGSDAVVWSGSPYTGSLDYAWHVYFLNGSVDYELKNSHHGHAIYLVRESQVLDIVIAGLFASLSEAGISSHRARQRWAFFISTYETFNTTYQAKLDAKPKEWTELTDTEIESELGYIDNHVRNIY